MASRSPTVSASISSALGCKPNSRAITARMWTSLMDDHSPIVSRLSDSRNVARGTSRMSSTVAINCVRVIGGDSVSLRDLDLHAVVHDTLARLGYSPADCVRLLQQVTFDSTSHTPITNLKQRVAQELNNVTADSFERALLQYAARETAPGIEQLPVHDRVKLLLREEFRYYLDPPTKGAPALEAGTLAFTVACQILSLRRFPAGPLDWELSGFPRSWLFSIHTRKLRTLAFLLTKTRGFAPMFFVHVARPPKKRALVIETEVLRSYYRIAKSLELQPNVKGILASAWFHDPEAVRRYPHLDWLNRPYLEGGGLIVTAGPAPPDSGIAERNLERQELLARGESPFRIGVAIWPRNAAIQWARNHPNLDA